MNIRIYTDDGEDGYVNYNEFTKEVLVTHTSPSIRRKVYKYLSTKKPLVVANSNKLGDRKTVKVVPKEKKWYLEMSLCEMYGIIGVHVDWSNGGRKDEE